MTDKANYSGGKSGNLHEGLKTKSPPVYDSSRAPIGSKYPSVDTGNARDTAKSPPTLGPRTA